jgi:hypothetical protein
MQEHDIRLLTKRRRESVCVRVCVCVCERERGVWCVKHKNADKLQASSGKKNNATKKCLSNASESRCPPFR